MCIAKRTGLLSECGSNTERKGTAMDIFYGMSMANEVLMLMLMLTERSLEQSRAQRAQTEDRDRESAVCVHVQYIYLVHLLNNIMPSEAHLLLISPSEVN